MPEVEIPSEALYRTSTLVESFAQLPPAPSFLRDKLFPRIITTASDLVSVEFFRGLQKLAPYCSRFSKGTSVPRERAQLSLFSPPFIKPVRGLTADELFYKGMQEASGTAVNRNAVLLTQDFIELDAMISRREEWMCSELLFTGSVKCLDGDTGEITYGTVSKTSPVKLWSDPTSDPLADLRGALRLVSSTSGASADLIVFGSDAADAFEANQQVLNAYDKLRIAPGNLTTENLSWGVQSLGNYRGLPLYVCESEYEDANGTMKPYVPPDQVLIAATSLAGNLSYAGIAQVSEDGVMNVYEGKRIPLIHYEAFEDYRKFRLSSRPVPVPQTLDAWTILDVL